MKVEIEISEEDAALILADHYYREPLAGIVEGLAQTAADNYRRAFRRAVPNAVEDFRRRQSAGENVIHPPVTA